MQSLEYLSVESQDAFGGSVKPVKFKDPDMQPSDNLKAADNLECGFLRASFEISNGSLGFASLRADVDRSR